MSAINSFLALDLNSDYLHELRIVSPLCLYKLQEFYTITPTDYQARLVYQTFRLFDHQSIGHSEYNNN